MICEAIKGEPTSDRVDLHLGDVQKTLFLPLGCAVETKKRKPLLVDETAVKIIEQVDYDFSQMTRNMDDLSKIAWITRSLICDQLVRKFLAASPEGAIVNIGCGLDAIFERVDDGNLKWYNPDLPM